MLEKLWQFYVLPVLACLCFLDESPLVRLAGLRERAASRSKRSALYPDNPTPWPNGIIPYVYSSDLSKSLFTALFFIVHPFRGSLVLDIFIMMKAGPIEVHNEGWHRHGSVGLFWLSIAVFPQTLFTLGPFPPGLKRYTLIPSPVCHNK